MPGDHNDDCGLPHVNYDLVGELDTGQEDSQHEVLSPETPCCLRWRKIDVGNDVLVGVGCKTGKQQPVFYVTQIIENPTNETDELRVTHYGNDMDRAGDGSRAFRSPVVPNVDIIPKFSRGD